MIRYVKLINERSALDAPNHAIVDGCPVGNIRDKPEILMRLGYLPLRVETPPEDPDAQPVYARVGDEIVQSWRTIPVIIPLDRTKLSTKLTELGLAALLNQWTQQDLSIATWWFSEMCYLKGSPMAEKIKTALSLTDEQLDAIVSDCRA